MSLQPVKPEWGTVRDAARKFGIGRNRLDRAIGKGEIHAYVPLGGQRWRYVYFRDVEAWLRRQRAAPSANAVDFARALIATQDRRRSRR